MLSWRSPPEDHHRACAWSFFVFEGEPVPTHLLALRCRVDCFGMILSRSASVVWSGSLVWTTLLPAGLTGLLLLGCGAQPKSVQSARGGDFTVLRAELEREKKSGELDEKRARAVAQALLAGEVERSQGPEGARTVRSFTACAGPLEDALRDRAETRDSAGGEAALILLERNSWCGTSPRSFTEDPDGAWRALAAQVSDKSNAGEQRRAFLADPDERVRRAAADAASRAKNEEDLSVLLETSRVDPDPLTRSRALRALGAFGSEKITLALRDRFDVATEGDQLAIIEAWSHPSSLEAGGKRQLELSAQNESGAVAIAAAAALSRLDSPEGERGFARLTHYLQTGTQEERRLALRLLPVEHAKTEERLLEASRDADERVALLATVRLLFRSAHETQAKKRLLDWARGAGALRYEARAALSVSKEESILPLLVQDKKSSSAEVRAQAGANLIRLGAGAEAALLLADPEAEVRRSVACTLLSPASR